MLLICLASPPSPRASPTCCSQLATRSLPSCLRCCAGWQRGVSPFLLLRVTLTSSAWPGEQAAPNRGRRSQMRDSRGGRSEVTLAEQRQGRSGSGTSKARTPLHPLGCDDPRVLVPVFLMCLCRPCAPRTLSQVFSRWSIASQRGAIPWRFSITPAAP